MTDWYLRACARLRAHNRRYEAVCETQPRQYSIVWMDWWVNASPKSNSCNKITSNKATCLIYQMPISVMVEISFCIEFQKISNSQTTKEAILLLNWFFKINSKMHRNTRLHSLYYISGIPMWSIFIHIEYQEIFTHFYFCSHFPSLLALAEGL